MRQKIHNFKDEGVYMELVNWRCYRVTDCNEQKNYTSPHDSDSVFLWLNKHKKREVYLRYLKQKQQNKFDMFCQTSKKEYKEYRFQVKKKPIIGIVGNSVRKFQFNICQFHNLIRQEKNWKGKNKFFEIDDVTWNT